MHPTEIGTDLIVQDITPPLRLSDFKLIAFDVASRSSQVGWTGCWRCSQP